MPSLWDYVINESLNKYSTNLALNRMQVNDIAHCYTPHSQTKMGRAD